MTEKEKLNIVLSLGREEVIARLMKESHEFRGSFIHQFAALEYFMLTIIINTSFNNSNDYIKYTTILNNGSPNLSFEKRIGLLKICIEKLEAKHGQKVGNLINDIKTFKKERDILAHGVLETDITALKDYLTKGIITYTRLKNIDEQPRDHFTKERIDQLVKSMVGASKSLVQMGDTILKDAEI